MHEQNTSNAPRSRTASIALAALAWVLVASAGSALAGALDDARVQKAEGRFEAALPLFQKAVEEAPDDPEAALGLGQVLAGLGRYADAVAALGAGIEKNPEHLGLLIERARTHLLIADAGDAAGADGSKILSDVADAELWIKRALALDAGSPDARVLDSKRLRYQGGGDSSESADVLRAVIADHPDHFDANWELAMHHFREGGKKQAAGREDWAEADRLFSRCAEIDPQSGMAVLNATFAKAWLGRPAAELAPGYERAAILLPGNEKALSRLYGAAAGDPAARAAAFKRIEATRPNDKSVLLFLAYAEGAAGDRKAGLATLDRAAKIAPDDPYVRFNKANMLLDMGDVAGAIKAFKTCMKNCGDVFYKDIYDQIGKHAWDGKGGMSVEQRDDLWTLIWEKWPTASDAPNNAGLWYRDNSKSAGNPNAMEKRSSIWYLRAVEAAPQNVQILNDTGLIFHYHLAEYDRAEDYYRRAVTGGREQGLDWTGGSGSTEDVGYRDAINNLGKLLAQTKQWKALGEFAEEQVPEEHPQREVWLALAKRGDK